MANRVQLQTGSAKALSVLGLTAKFLARGQDTDGTYAAVELTYPAGVAVGKHIHANEEEALLVLEGELECVLGDETFTARAGDFQLVPRGTVHGQANESNSAARVLAILSPADFEGFFDEADGADLEAVLPLLDKYQMQLVDDGDQS